jgi:hypothetical protein
MQRRRQKKLVPLLRFSRIDAFQQHVSDVDLRLRLVTRNGPAQGYGGVPRASEWSHAALNSKAMPLSATFQGS